MPIYEYKCQRGHQFSRLFRTFGEADKYQDGAPCQHTGCTLTASRLFSVPLKAHFYGKPDGYEKPSPTGRHSYRHAASYGNRDSMG